MPVIDRGMLSKAEYPRLASEGRVHMDGTTSDNLDKADEDMLSYTVSDEALEAAAADAHLQAQPLTQWSWCLNPACGV